MAKAMIVTNRTFKAAIMINLLLICWRDTLVALSLHYVLLVDLSSKSGLPIKWSHLLIDVLSIIAGHLHTTIVVVKCAIWHLECFLWNSTNTTEISLVTLVFKDCFLTQLDSVFFFEFTDHGLEEIKLFYFFFYAGFNFILYFFFKASFIHFIACNLNK